VGNQDPNKGEKGRNGMCKQQLWWRLMTKAKAGSTKRQRKLKQKQNQKSHNLKPVKKQKGVYFNTSDEKVWMCW